MVFVLGCGLVWIGGCEWMSESGWVWVNVWMSGSDKCGDRLERQHWYEFIWHPILQTNQEMRCDWHVI